MPRVTRNIDEKEQSQSGGRRENSMNVVERDRARKQLVERAKDDEADVVDIEASDSYSVASELREQFRDFFNGS